jgi:hypothetical protein
LSEQTTTKTLLPTVLLLLPSFQALQFQYIILIPYNFGRLYSIGNKITNRSSPSLESNLPSRDT